MKDLGNAIKRNRARMHLSQRELAQHLGISIRTLQSWEQGIRKPSAAAQAHMERIMRCPNMSMNSECADTLKEKRS